VLIKAQNKDTDSIRVVTIDPLDMINSKTFFRSHVPVFVKVIMTIGGWLLPLIRYLQPSVVTVEEAARPVVDVALAKEYAGQEGYFEGRKKVESSPDSLDEDLQRRLWQKSVEWCGLTAGDSVIKL
jgi:hypothetical protein